ncbi:SDR family oxidoreductase [Myxococcus sp. CA051A]|uniref:SDR family oxidoreductase n=1 Tax=unclassified Myxococcus TaxID=2648731 RepID=UPI00157ADD79|nr:MULTISPECIES: SDR family oxidoreductase [unclassified Myxococcus]NTX12033.1 SDR family oxidoreductase [Myxococcus sp. CA056]NTX33048.1 SDR family oxidoreductase [Myxococcus sp. CA033]NTX57010.1 SDR family oxidoreductase [Myxococcus sp. CA039A]NTX59888.1 SDR family oxidoreductase [Myxococcus sp. CA051A]
MQVKNAVALVTGANRGLGLAFAKALLERGARKVYAAAREPSSVTIPGVVPVRLDVTRPEQLEALVREAGDVTLLINNAGILKGTSLLGADALSAARAELETNYLGPLATSSAFAPVLAKNGGGAIINVLSVLSWMAFPGSASYSASKAAAWALTNGLRKELGAQKTQVMALHVGYMDTDMAEKVTAPKTSTAEVVRLTLDALEAGQDEVLADEVSRNVKQGLSAGVYLQRS